MFIERKVCRTLKGRSRKRIVKKNGCTCYFCGINQAKKLKPAQKIYELFSVHHIHPLANEGIEDESNYLVMCLKCHEELHMFIDMFRIEENVDYELLTYVFANNFAKNSRGIRQSNRFDPEKFGDAQEMMSTFWKFVLGCQDEVKALFYAYMKYKKEHLKSRPFQKNCKLKRHHVVRLFQKALRISDKYASIIGKYRKMVECYA
ncbi:MAG TPA: hypothetical protein DCL21_04770 [Alphaproteobacteria bacterium]|nr:hypothetical protein [Alphaproteobacteria bacterium]